MREMDLIPEDYRVLQLSRKMLMVFAAVIVTVILSAIAGRLLLGMKTGSVEEKITLLTEQSKSLQKYQVTIDELEADKTEIARELAFVEMLQAGGQASIAFEIFDNALNNAVWLQQIGYLADNLINEEEAAHSDEHAASIKSALNAKITAQGEATNHAELTLFVERLINQPKVSDVRVLKSSIADPAAGIVSFELEIH